MIKIYNTETRRKEELVPVHPGEVRMYVCGPTVYNYIHIGNARTFISFDTVRRYLIWRGYDVRFVQNVTDVDDKIIKRAAEDGTSAEEVARTYTDAFIADMRAAGVMDPDVRPRATEEIPEMIALVEKLIATGHAYESQGDVYFAVRSFPDYGKLSGRNVDEMESGHRDLRAAGQGLEDRKRDELDFAVWKAAKPGEPSWDSPWGPGRPGWHIECSAMSEKYLGLPFDIHGGGADLVFPHHENEIAQSEAACSCCFANLWMHGGMLQIDSEKMSKSLGNFLLLRDVLAHTPAAVLRMLMLQTHYRSPLDFSDERLHDAAAALERLRASVTNLRWLASHPVQREGGSGDAAAGEAADVIVDFGAVDRAVLALEEGFVESMDDDFNTAGALGAIFACVAELNSAVAGREADARAAESLDAAAARIEELMGVLGVQLADEAAGAAGFEGVGALAASLGLEAAGDDEATLDALLALRTEARAAKDWARADAVRDGLAELGLTVEDTPQGPRVVRA